MDIPQFEPEEIAAAIRQRLAKERRARRRYMRRVDRYWLMSWLRREGYPQYDEDPRYFRACQRAYFRSLRAWQSIHIQAKRLTHKRFRRNRCATHWPRDNGD